jgi:hypothetical protein
MSEGDQNLTEIGSKYAKELRPLYGDMTREKQDDQLIILSILSTLKKQKHLA